MADEHGEGEVGEPVGALGVDPRPDQRLGDDAPALLVDPRLHEGHPLVAVRPGPDRGLGLVRERQREVLEDVDDYPPFASSESEGSA